jgi:hypothetical protein
VSNACSTSENRNDPDLVQAFLKKWWVELDFKAPNPPLSLRLKGSGCHYNSIYNNNYEFGLSLCKIVRSSVILLLPLFILSVKLAKIN